MHSFLRNVWSMDIVFMIFFINEWKLQPSLILRLDKIVCVSGTTTTRTTWDHQCSWWFSPFIHCLQAQKNFRSSCTFILFYLYWSHKLFLWLLIGCTFLCTSVDNDDEPDRDPGLRLNYWPCINVRHGVDMPLVILSLHLLLSVTFTSWSLCSVVQLYYEL